LRLHIHLFVAGLLTTTALTSWGQVVALPEPPNVVSLSASASMDVPQDWLTMTLSVTKEGTEPSTVQSQVRAALDGALNEAKSSAGAGVEVHTGSFSLQPRYGREGKIASWVGNAELVLEGRDFARIGALAGKLQSMTVLNSSFSLSRDAKARVVAEVQGQAIEKFRYRAGEIARSFGFGGYTLREVSVSSDDQTSYAPRFRAVGLAAVPMAADAAPVPVEAGKLSVVISINGSVQLK
jgi:predicted secreted protein